MPKHLLSFKAKDAWKGTVCSCDDRPPGQRTGSGHGRRVPRTSGVTCWLGGPDTPPGLGRRAPANPQRWRERVPEARPGRSTCQRTRVWDQETSGGFAVFWRASRRSGFCRVPQGGALGAPQDLGSRMFWRWWRRSRRRADGGRTAPGVHHAPPHGCEVPWTLAGGQRPQERGTGGSDESRGHSPRG